MPIVLDRERNPRDDRQALRDGRAEAGCRQSSTRMPSSRPIARQLQTDHPISNANTGAVVRPLLELLGGNINAAVYLLVVVPGASFVCIACANVSSIILARAGTRRRELAVQRGAWRGTYSRRYGSS